MIRTSTPPAFSWQIRQKANLFFAFLSFLFLFTAEVLAQTPLKICAVTDQSTSSIAQRTERLSYGLLQEPIASIEDSGGELAVTAVRTLADTNVPLIRYYVPEPPTRPVLETGGTPAEERKMRQIHAMRMVKWVAEMKEREARTAAEKTRFREEVVPLLLHELDATESAVHDAIFRCNLYLSESDTQWATPPLKYILFVSDSAHWIQGRNVARDHGRVEALAPGTRLFIVNDSRDGSALSYLHPSTFENIAGALREMMAEVNRSNQ